ncbi:hypothetical protein M407DRAFT_242327 [Tulasnella calospora MUT 4182]|uniref:Uncharacterized protein n=1 Tax=Tulasnella calospora MUT 4182 TaxID=1051891 RepID=A0A0C3L8I4_9AGAM|nr:hypothetical protein M407DRAFT_242327 [Tulasnella calospora MUT 4182]
MATPSTSPLNSTYQRHDPVAGGPGRSGMPALSHNHSNPQQKDDDCGPLFAYSP